MMCQAVFTASLVLLLEAVVVASDFIHTVSFNMKWRNPVPEEALILCTGQSEKYVHVVAASGFKQTKRGDIPYYLTESELFSLELACSCEEQCAIPQLIKFRKRSWTLVVRYKCQDICLLCENHMATLSCATTPETKLNITYANYGRTLKDVCTDPNPSHFTNDVNCKDLENTLAKVKAECQNKVFCDLQAKNTVFGDTCNGTYKYLEVRFECKVSESPTTTVRVTTTEGRTIPSTTAFATTTTSTTKRVTTSPQTTAEVSRPTSTVGSEGSSTRSISITENAPTTGQWSTKKDNLAIENKTGKSTTTAVAVSITFVAVAVSVAAFILICRRRRRKRVDEVVNKTATDVADKNDIDGFTNMTYSKDVDSVTLHDSQQRPIDANSNSGDSGYTDMHNEDTREADNDYYMIKENRESNSAEIVDNQYYAINDNVSSEYNKITFKPKVIPDDSIYGHTLRPGQENGTDETYDHAESSGTILHAQLQENNNEYSHLNKRKPKIRYGEKHTAIAEKVQGIPIPKETGDDGFTGHDYFVLEQDGNEQPTDSTNIAGHDYFVLEKAQSQQIDQGRTTVTDAECHDYFVLSKEESTGKPKGNKSVFKPKDFGTCLKYNTPNEIENDVNDHTYFENPLSTELEDDIHQYQGMDHPSSNIEPENTNHDYFILEKS